MRECITRGGVECACGKVFVPGGGPLCWINEGRKKNEH